MTIVIPPYEEQPKVPAGRPKGSRGNGKTLTEIKNREEKSLARISMEASIKEARAAAEQINQIADLRAQQKSRVAEQYVAQESKRAPQTQIDQRPVLYLLIALAAIMFVASAALTADGTIGSSLAARFEIPWFGFLLFGVFEVAILVFMLTYYVQGSRVDIITNKRKFAGHWFFAMIVASGVTVAASAYHVMDLYDYEFTNIDLWVGIGLRVVAALFFVIVSKAIATVVFARAVDITKVG